jgi:hypothetical protein
MTDLYKTIDDIKHAKCGNCKGYKPYDKKHFYTDKGRIRHSNCKECKKAKAKDYTQNNKDKRNEYMRRYRRRKREEKLKRESLLNK